MSAAVAIGGGKNTAVSYVATDMSFDIWITPSLDGPGGKQQRMGGESTETYWNYIPECSALDEQIVTP